MTATWLPEDEVFFREYNRRTPGQKRSLPRARQLQLQLGLGQSDIPLVTVVGSKGKGTAAICAAAALSSTGLKVGLITSPPFRTNRERIRIDGREMSVSEYRRVANMLGQAIGELGPCDSGYLSPGGCFTVSGMAYLLASGCDAVVLEEGIGGRSDEISLFSPTVVCVTPIFEEHVGIVGEAAGEIAEDLLGVASRDTRTIVSAEQDNEVADIVRATAARTGAELEWVSEGLDLWVSQARGPSRANARVGVRSGLVLSGYLGRSGGGDPAVMDTVAWPGRLSTHRHGEQQWLVDAAIDPGGAAMALDWCRTNIGEPDLVFLCLPDIKDAEGVVGVFSGLPTVGVKVGESYLSYDSAVWQTPLVTWDEARTAAEAVPGLILAVGTISFVGEVLEYLDADCGCAYTVPLMGGFVDGRASAPRRSPTTTD